MGGKVANGNGNNESTSTAASDAMDTNVATVAAGEINGSECPPKELCECERNIFVLFFDVLLK